MAQSPDDQAEPEPKGQEEKGEATRGAVFDEVGDEEPPRRHEGEGAGEEGEADEEWEVPVVHGGGRVTSLFASLPFPLPSGERGLEVQRLHRPILKRRTVQRARLISPCETFDAPAIRSSKRIGTSTTG